MSFKLIALAVLGLAAAPLFAQETGPGGLAEPHVKMHLSPEPPPFNAPKIVPQDVLNLQLSDGGTVSVLLRPDKAPLSVARIKALAERHFYDGLTFHRVIDGFMAQGGDPKGDGSGGSDLPDVKGEMNDLPHVRGAMAMARASSRDSANSQFYIMLSPDLTLDTDYTVIGRVVQGMAYVDGIQKGEPPAHPTKILHAYIGAPPASAGGPVLAEAGDGGALPGVPVAGASGPPSADASAAGQDAAKTAGDAPAVAPTTRRRRPR